MKFRVTCDEEVATEIFVKAPSEEALQEWLEKHGADAVSSKMHRQTVHDRGYTTEEWPDASPEADFRVEPKAKHIYLHDCSDCVFLKPLVLGNEIYDVYRCPPGVLETSYIARYGNAVSEYWSMPWDIMQTAKLEEGTPLLRAMFEIAQAEEKRRNEEETKL